jgi:hypothetical protein
MSGAPAWRLLAASAVLSPVTTLPPACCQELPSCKGSRYGQDGRTCFAAKRARLTAVKDAYDPDNIFHLNHNIAPTRH